MIGTLSADEIEATLRRHRIGRLACSLDDHPYIVPINYHYDGVSILSYSMLGRKIETMRAQPRVCFQVDEIDGPNNWRCVIADGRYEEIVDEVERREVLGRLLVPGGTPVDRSLGHGGRLVVFRLRLTQKSGRFERQDGWSTGPPVATDDHAAR